MVATHSYRRRQTAESAGSIQLLASIAIRAGSRQQVQAGRRDGEKTESAGPDSGAGNRPNKTIADNTTRYSTAPLC
jgi:hypothetical protein